MPLSDWWSWLAKCKHVWIRSLYSKSSWSPTYQPVTSHKPPCHLLSTTNTSSIITNQSTRHQSINQSITSTPTCHHPSPPAIRTHLVNEMTKNRTDLRWNERRENRRKREKGKRDWKGDEQEEAHWSIVAVCIYLPISIFPTEFRMIRRREGIFMSMRYPLLYLVYIKLRGMFICRRLRRRHGDIHA